MGMLNEIAQRAHENSAAHGFWDDEPRNGTAREEAVYYGNKLALIHSEVSEAFEWVRQGLYGPQHQPGEKPEGLPSELADIVIRVGDLAERLGISLEAVVAEKHLYNINRPHMHGKLS